MSIKCYLVGGAVRDMLRNEIFGTNIKVHDMDYTVVADSFEAMRHELIEVQGFTEHQVREEFATIRAGVPKGHPIYHLTKDADFVWAREDGPYSDGRRPDWIKPANLLEDLRRRDFTMNAIAIDPETDEYIDPFHGREHIEGQMLRFVGDPMERLLPPMGDALRAVRGLRFMVTQGLTPTLATWDAMTCPEVTEAIATTVAVERIAQELDKMFAHDTVRALDLLCLNIPRDLLEVLMPARLFLSAHLRGA